METEVFDGQAFAKVREQELTARIRANKLEPRIGAVIFQEDRASVLYSKIKKQAAVRVGVEFSEQLVSIKEPVSVLQDKVRIYAEREDVDGVLVQKPMKETWTQQLGLGDSEDYDAWWRRILLALPAAKDVDCLTAQRLQAVYDGKWQILPATVKAIISILVWADRKYHLFSSSSEKFELVGHNFVVVGRSDLIGKPLTAALAQYGAKVLLFGQDLNRDKLAEAEVVISATGVPGLLKGEMVRAGAVVVDVGAPKGDLDRESFMGKARLVTPVPGGVGPVTVVSLLENLVDLNL